MKNVNISDGKRKHRTIYKQNFVDKKETYVKTNHFIVSFDDSKILEIAEQTPGVYWPKLATVSTH